MRALLGPIAAAALLVPALWTSPAAAQHKRHHEEDGPRFRGGVALEGGGIFISGYGLGLVGVEGRLGVQINNMIGVYAQPEFSLGGGKYGTGTGFTGTAGSTAVVDFTFLNRFFVGVGGGAAIIQSAAAGEFHFRAGGYPVFTHGLNGVRRKGLMVGLDLRVYPLLGVYRGTTLMSPMLAIGYEAY